MKKFLILSIMFSGMLSCSKDSEMEPPIPPQPNPEIELKIPININMSVQTRMVDNTFEGNDKVGLYVVNVDASGLGTKGNHVDNMGFLLTDKGWTPDQEIFWKDGTTPAHFYCYYPYATQVTSVKEYKHSIKTDQTDKVNYNASEFLWGKRENVAPSESAVNLTMKHLMSKLIIHLENGKGYTGEDLKKAQVRISNLCPTAAINLANGTLQAIDAPADITPNSEGDHYKALVVPQNVSQKPLIKVILGENVYTLTTSINFESGKQHTCTVKVSKLSNGISIGIDGWQTDGVDHGGDAY